MSEHKLIQRQIILDHPNARILVDTIEHQGKQRSYFYLTSPVEAVATVGLTSSCEIILIRQYRHPIGRVILDLPAGHLDPGEAPIDGARREFEE